MYERRHHKPLPKVDFIGRLLRHYAAAMTVICFSLLIGICGYHYLEGLAWIDALLNASMILAGMGPVNALHSNSGKIFASFYALFSGVIFLVTVSIVIAPVVHRLLHVFHFDVDE